jgi:hypothetical protein
MTELSSVITNCPAASVGNTTAAALAAGAAVTPSLPVPAFAGVLS